jgi:hypothetical protein
MSRTTRRTQSIGAGAVGIALGLLPRAAPALENPGAPISVAAVGQAVPATLCAPMSTQPFNIPLGAPADAVKNAPYSGVGTTEVVTTLADGNRITRTNTMRYFRDSAGRTRTEYQLAAIGPFVPEEAQSIVTITDPVAGLRYVLHPGMKRADEFKLGKGEPAVGAGAIFVGGRFTSLSDGPQQAGSPALVQSTRVGGRARLEAPRSRGVDKRPTMLGGNAFTGGSGGVNVAEPMRGHVIADAPGEPGPPMFDVLITHAGPPEGACRTAEAMKNAKPVSIGERRIEGLKVTGSRLELTIEAGSVGNELPITVRTDQWFSPDLGVVVSSTHNDPMIGESTYRLEQINRAEPDEALFRVPAEYARQPIGF